MSLTHCEWWCWADDVNLQAWLFLVQFWMPPRQHLFKKAFVLSLNEKVLYVEEEDFFCCLYIFIFRIMVEGFYWSFGFSLCRFEMFMRMILTWIKGDLLAVLWLCFSAGTVTNNEKAIISPSPTFILRINEWLRSLCSKIIAHGPYKKNKKSITFTL